MADALSITDANVEVQGYAITAGDVGVALTGGTSTRWKLTNLDITATSGVTISGGEFLFLGGAEITAGTVVAMANLGDACIYSVTGSGDLDVTSVGNLEIGHSSFANIDLVTSTAKLQSLTITGDITARATVLDLMGTTLNAPGGVTLTQSVLDFYGNAQSNGVFDLTSSVASIYIANDADTESLLAGSTLICQTLPGDDGSYLTDVTMSGRGTVISVGGDAVEISGDGSQQSAIVVGGFDNSVTDVSAVVGCPSGVRIDTSDHGAGALCVGGYNTYGGVYDGNRSSGLIAVGGKGSGFFQGSPKEAGLIVVGGYGQSGIPVGGDWYGGCVAVGGTLGVAHNSTPGVTVVDCNPANTFKSNAFMHYSDLCVTGYFPSSGGVWGVNSSSLFVCGEPTAPQVTLLGGIGYGEITLQRRNDNKYYSVAAGAEYLIIEALGGFERYATVSELGLGSNSRQTWYSTGRS